MQSRFDQALQSILVDASKQPRIAVAYSGGLDSTVLLHLSAAFAQQHSLHLIALHVHHGISKNADQWVTHCEQQCTQLSVPFDVARVELGNTSDEGIEATARKKRYAALGEMCNRHQIDIILTAHHQDDQAETMLLQLLRGTGVAGMGGMQKCHRAAGLLNNATVLVGRPLLECTREELEGYVSLNKISHIEDESNADMRYTRNALRHQIMPLLAQHFPGYQARFSRTAHHARSALGLIEQFAKQDYEHCRVGASELNALELAKLPEARIDNVLRYWIAAHGVQMPSTARLEQMRHQLLQARDDAQVCVRHGEVEVHRYRHQLSLAKLALPTPDVKNFVWKGEASLAFPEFGGTLHFDLSPTIHPGINRDWLLQQSLQLRPRQGGERLKLAINRPTRSIKSHYQTLGIPYWQRERLPFVFAGADLVFAAGVGVQGEFLMGEEGAERVILRWQADT